MRKQIRLLLAELLAAELARVDPPFTPVGRKSTAGLRYTTQLGRQQFRTALLPSSVTE